MIRTLVKLPASAQHTVLSFPFLKLLSSLEDRELFVIADPGNSVLLDGLEDLEIPSSRIFEIPQNKKTFLGAHHYLMNNHDIFNVQEFFDLESSLSSMSLGLTAKAPLRVGFEKGLVGKLSYHRKVLWNGLAPIDKSYVQLLVESLGVSDRKAYLEVIPGGSVVPLVKYLFIGLKGLFDPVTRELYSNFINGMEHTAFIFWDLDGDLSHQFFELIHPNIEFKIIKTCDLREVRNIMKTSVGMVTNQSWMAWLAAYWGIKTLVLNEQLEKTHYFDLLPQELTLLESRTDEAIDFVCQNFNL